MSRRSSKSLKSFSVHKVAKKLTLVGYLRARNAKEPLEQARKDAREQDRDRLIVRPAP